MEPCAPPSSFLGNHLILQFIGLPATGKTTLLKKYLSSIDTSDIEYIDIANVGMKAIEAKLSTNKNKHYIIESACGISLRNSLIIKMRISNHERKKLWYQRENRDLDPDYESLLQTAMLPANFTVTSEEAAFSLLNELLNKYEAAITSLTNR